MSTSTRQGVVMLLVGAVAATLLAAAATDVHATASPTAADLGVSATVGFGRGPSAAAWTLVEVTAAPDRPLAGEVGARTRQAGHVSTTRELEVAAGATKVVPMLLPPGHDVEVWVATGDGERIGVPFERRHGGVLVGGLDGAPALPDPLNSAGTDRPVRGVAVDRDVLALGARALDALDALVVPAEDLHVLPEEHRDALTVAVATGLDLVVPVRAGDGPLPLPWDPLEAVDGAGTQPSLVPATGAWTLTSRDLGAEGDRTVVGSVPAGRGRVLAVAAAPGQEAGIERPADLWGAVLQPRAGQVPLLGGQGQDPGAALFGHGAGLPGVRGVALFLIAFLVVVGPVNALLLRRLGRRELAWVTVPAITLLFTGVAVVTALAGTPTTSPVVRAAWWQDGVGEEVTAVGLQAPSRGVHAIAFPGARDALLAEGWTDSPASIARERDRTVLSVHLESLQVATAVGLGPVTAPAPLEVHASTADGRLSVEVTNASAATLDDVQVHLATHEVRLDPLGPGESAVVEEELDDTLPRPRFAGHRHGFGQPRMGGAQPEPPGPEAAQDLLRWTLLDRSPGTVWVTATTTDDLGLLDPSVPGRADDRGSFVAVGATPEHDGGGLWPHQVRRDLLHQADWAPWRPDPLSIEAHDEVVLRFRIPTSQPQGPLLSTLDAGGPVRHEDLLMRDPFGDGCFEVVEIGPDGERGEPEERCGHDVACPPTTESCAGSDREVEACFPDGTCQIATRIPDQRDEAGPAPDGLEVYDHRDGAWLPAAEVFADGKADLDRVASPLGEVLVRAREVGHLEFGQRGLGVEGGT